jgi:DNA-directed RNA polymerase specialized sigma24 family protein
MQDVPLGTVKYRMHEARRRMKKEMIAMVEDVLRGMVIW